MKIIVYCFVLFFCQTLALEDITPSSGFSDNADIILDMAGLVRCEIGTWVPAENGNSPLGGLTVGVDNKTVVTLARAEFMGNIIPGKFYQAAAYVPYHNKENMRDKYEIFCGATGPYTWVKTDGNIPENAVLAGETEDSQPLYACRVKVDAQDASGSVQNSICYIPFNGSVVTYLDYEILTSEIGVYDPDDSNESD